MTDLLGFVYAADTFCVDCATVDLGAAAIERMKTGKGAPSQADYGASTAADWPRDSEGNPITMIYRHDAWDWAENGCYCSSCRKEIIEPAPKEHVCANALHLRYVGPVTSAFRYVDAETGEEVQEVDTRAYIDWSDYPCDCCGDEVGDLYYMVGDSGDSYCAGCVVKE